MWVFSAWSHDFVCFSVRTLPTVPSIFNHQYNSKPSLPSPPPISYQYPSSSRSINIYNTSPTTSSTMSSTTTHNKTIRTQSIQKCMSTFGIAEAEVSQLFSIFRSCGLVREVSNKLVQQWSIFFRFAQNFPLLRSIARSYPKLFTSFFPSINTIRPYPT